MRKHLKKVLICGEICMILTIVYIMVTTYPQSTYLGRNSSQENYTTVTEAPTPMHLKSTRSSKSNQTEEKTYNQRQYIGKIIEDRRARVSSQCSDTSLGNRQRKSLHSDVLRRLYADEKHYLVWCPIYKAASSTFMKIFANLGNVLTPAAQKQLAEGKTQLNFLARQAFPVLNQKKMGRLLSISNRLLVVRHPFERLLSAFRDKLEYKKVYYHKKFGRKIVQLYGNLSVSQVPTFNQFLTYIAHGHPFDEHWRPYYQECAPCKFDYNFILKTESLHEEQEYLAYATNTTEFLPNGLVNTNPTGQTDLLTAEKYFSTIPINLLKSIYMIYQMDFQLFDYNADPYFAMIKDNSLYQETGQS